MKNLKPFIQSALQALKFEHWTDIQAAVIPSAISGRDLIVSSQTGTGKTHAFLVPIFQQLRVEIEEVQAVILSPTRELAAQIEQFAKQLAAQAPETIRIALYTGGSDRDRERASLAKKQPHIVIGTPGRIEDLAVKAPVLKIHTAKQLIIDEADMALESGFLDSIERIYAIIPNRSQMMVFSATLPESLRPFLKRSMNQPRIIDQVDHSLSNLDLIHTFVKCTPERTRDSRLKETMAAINPYLALIFANKKEDVDRLGRQLYQEGFNVVVLHGDLPPRKRKQILNDIRRLKYQYIVASDMASRGIDLEGVSHIINYDLPKDMAFFVHRIGRSGRMGHSGETISFFTDADESAFDFIEKHQIAITIKGGQRPPRRSVSKKPSGPSPRTHPKVLHKTKQKPQTKKTRRRG